MGRKKGSLNKKNQPIQLNFYSDINNIKKSSEQVEVLMTTGILEDVEEVNASNVNSDNLAKDMNELELIQQELDLARVELEKTKLEIEEKRKDLEFQKTRAENPKFDIAIGLKDNSLKDKIAKQKAYDNTMVTGKFSNLRAPGQTVKLPYIKYEDDPVKWYTFVHGEVYTIPRGFADQLNGGSEDNPCYYMPHFIKNEGAILDPTQPESGIHAVDSSNKKYMFSPINF